MGKQNSYIYPYNAALTLAQNKKVINLLSSPSQTSPLLTYKLQKLAEALGFDEFFIINTQAIIVAHTGNLGIGTNFSNSNWAQISLSGEATETAILSPITGTYDFLISFPVYSENKIIGAAGLINFLHKLHPQCDKHCNECDKHCNECDKHCNECDKHCNECDKHYDECDTYVKKYLNNGKHCNECNSYTKKYLDANDDNSD